MTAEWSVPAWAVLATVAVVLGLALLGVLTSGRSRRLARAAQVAQAASLARAEALGEQVAAIERRLATQDAAAIRVDETEYLVTMLGRDNDRNGTADSEPAPVVGGPLFADLVLRESVVQAASFASGLRRALEPAHLNRIRFEMRREIKRARKQRRANLRQARREYEARERAGGAAA